VSTLDLILFKSTPLLLNNHIAHGETLTSLPDFLKLAIFLPISSGVYLISNSFNSLELTHFFQILLTISFCIEFVSILVLFVILFLAVVL
jgi:hypothetical protein